jgi:hypothetical protein
MWEKEHTEATFLWVIWMDMASFNGKTEIYTRVNLKIIKNMDLESIIANKVIIKVCIKKDKDADKEK